MPVHTTNKLIHTLYTKCMYIVFYNVLKCAFQFKVFVIKFCSLLASVQITGSVTFCLISLEIFISLLLKTSRHRFSYFALYFSLFIIRCTVL